MEDNQSEVVFQIRYNSNYAYVDAAFISEVAVVWQGLESWKTNAILKLVMDGKRIRVEDFYSFRFKCSDLEREFFKIAKRIPVTEWGLWRKIVHKLEEGQSKQEVLDWVMTEAIARGLTL